MKKQRLNGLVKRIEVVKVRCTILEKKQIEKLAHSSNLPVATYMRRKSMNHKIHRTLSPDEAEAIKTLSRYNTALTRLSSLIKSRQPNLDHEIQLLVSNIQEWYLNLIANDRES